MRQNLIFHQLFEKESSTYTYLLADKETLEGILIDGVRETLQRDLELIQELGVRLKYILDTHVHADHITSSGPMREATGAKIVLGKASGVARADILIADGESLPFGQHTVTAISTPGHTSACTTFRVGDRVFTGDTLLIRGCGRTDFQQGDSKKMYHSIHHKLFCLDEDTLVYPGHDYKGRTSSTIGQEKRHNPRLTLDEAGFVELMANLNLAPPKKLEQSVPANLHCGMGEV